MLRKSSPAAAAEAQVFPSEKVLPSEKALLAEKVFPAQRMEIFGRLTGGIAHDLNNVLTVITGTIGILAEAVGSANGRVEVDSEAGHGTSVKIYLPQARGIALIPP